MDDEFGNHELVPKDPIHMQFHQGVILRAPYASIQPEP